MKWWGIALLGAGLVAGTARADSEVGVYCGSVRCVTLHAPAHGQSAEQRADWAMGLLNKYLGGKTARFGTARRGPESQILLNGEVLLAVTPADAKAERVKSVPSLAEKWRVSFAKAFAVSSAQK